MIVVPGDLFAVARQINGSNERAERWLCEGHPAFFGMSPAELLERGCERELRKLMARRILEA